MHIANRLRGIPTIFKKVMDILLHEHITCMNSLRLRGLLCHSGESENSLLPMLCSLDFSGHSAAIHDICSHHQILFRKIGM